MTELEIPVLEKKKKTIEVLDNDFDFDFRGTDTQYSTHAIHTYVAAMVPELAKVLVQSFVPKGKRILDPFCGGGAVLVESVHNGNAVTGTDINPLAILLSKAKTTYIEKKSLQEAVEYTYANAVRGVNGSMKFPENYSIDYWFLPQSIAELTSFITVIKKCERKKIFSEDVIRALKVMFSATVRDVMLTYRNEVRLRRLQPEDLKRIKPDAFKSFTNRSKLAIERISSLPVNANSNVECCDIKQLPFPDKYFHSIICSPPYGDETNGVSYLQFSKFMLYWLGFTRESVINTRKKALGSTENDIILKSKTLIKVSKEISKRSEDTHWINFYTDYYDGLKQMSRVSKENIIIVVGNRILKQTLIENGRVTTELMSSLNWKLHRHFERKLPSKRLPKLRRENSHGFGGAIDKEDILIFKPN